MARHATNLEMLKLGNMKKCSGRNTHQGATRKLNSMTDFTSRGGVLEERVYARCPQHVSTTTNTAQPQGLALCSRCHLAWASEGTPVGPGKDTHGTLGPGKRGGRGWPTTIAQRAKCRTHQTVQNTGLPTHF